jgi:D-cysteine desulfhydrase
MIKQPDFDARLSRRVVLVQGVTPVRRLDAISTTVKCDVFVKQDNETSAIYGGTKTRKLEFILQAAGEAGARSLVTLGSWASHHVIATALHARALGLPVHAVVSPQPHSPLIGHALHRCTEAGVTLYPASSELGSAYGLWTLLRSLRRSGDSPYLVNLGGSSGVGMLGTVRAALELVAQIAEQKAPRTGPIYVALGSGSSAAGLALGLVLAGAPRPIRAIQVTSSLVVNRFVLNRLMHAGASLLVEPRHRNALVKTASQCISIDQSALGQGYGWPSDKGNRATALAALDGLVLDPTYTAKVVAAILDGAQAQEPVLYWHTLAEQNPPPPGQLRLPPWYQAPLVA